MDLGRSSHIHITTWGTLSRQKKGQRSKGPEGASIISFNRALLHLLYCVLFSVYPAMMLTSCCVLTLLYLFHFFFFFFEAWRRPPPAATEDNYTNTDKSASQSYTLKSRGLCRMQLATVPNTCAKQ